jgi:hypothetical protein
VSTTGTAARLSTTSEGLWLAAALCNVANLPSALKIRPVGSVQATLADHPGLAVLDAAGVIADGRIDPDVASWVAVLGRPDLEVDVSVSRPEEQSARLLGPPPLFVAPDDPIEAAEALAQWYADRPPQRVAALCRRDGTWVGAARLWRPGQDSSDDIVISPLGSAQISEAVIDVLGAAAPAHFHGINSEAAALNSALSAWQANPAGHDLIADLVGIGVTVPQARLVEAVADRGTTRAVVSAAQFSIDGKELASTAVTVVDTVLGRAVVSNVVGPDGRQWTTLLPGTEDAITRAVLELLGSLPCGRDWATHQRI